MRSIFRFVMLTLHRELKYRLYGNWIVNSSVLLCYINIIILQACDLNNDTSKQAPLSWPCEWRNGVIPFAFDYFSMSPRRLMSLVRKAHDYFHASSCLVFEQQNPVKAARRKNFTYLFYTYSEVLESCCLPFFTKARGKRLILITPVCSLSSEIVHATLHGLGLSHFKYEPFSNTAARNVMFITDCQDMENKQKEYDSITL